MKKLQNIAAVLSVLSIFSSSGVVHAEDANFNSQLSNIRSAATGVPTDPTLGFDPCKGGANVSGICNAATGPLLSIANVGNVGTVGIFSQLGPGAVTDNMFGIISGPALGATVLIGDDTATTNCAPGTGTPNFDLSVKGGLNGLNCGSIRINASQQGQLFPAGPNSLGLEGNGTVNTVTKNMSFIDDKCIGGSTVCPEGAHVGFNLTNNFTFRINTDAITGAAIPTEATTTSAQTIRQVTGVNVAAGIGTLLLPGGGDQFFEVTSSFTARSPDTADGATLDPLVVNWMQTIIDPDQSGASGAKFEQSLGGTFTRDEQFGGLSQVFDCPSGTTATTINICSQYPNGLSQTTGDITGATLP
jgi:hypothetical protein